MDLIKVINVFHAKVGYDILHHGLGYVLITEVNIL